MSREKRGKTNFFPGKTRPTLTYPINERRRVMKDLHKIFSSFKEDFPKVYSDHEDLGKEIHSCPR
jgi:hypothetical protein